MEDQVERPIMTGLIHTDSHPSQVRRRRLSQMLFWILILFLFLVTAGATLSGSTHISLKEMAAAFRTVITTHDATDPAATILWEIRLPRILLTALAGAALAISGACLQGIFQNPMADPYILGLSSGGALGAAIAITFGLDISLLGLSSVPLFALVGAMATALAVLRLGQTNGKIRPETLLLAGIAVNAFLSAIVSFLMTLNMERGTFGGNSLYWWLMGGFYTANWVKVQSALPYVLVGALVILLYARDLNLLLMGEESALHLGVEVERAKKLLLLAASLTAAAAVSVSGIIGFVGLIAPHIIRLIVGPDHRRLLPSSALLGAIFLMVCDTLARTLLAPTEIPVGILTAFTGVPFFLYLLKRNRG